jgi:hypothetical protein|tara:strand:+ start:192 stop:386 length:195 start_codon:yes stop_codon:yes gene_type:complete
MNESNLNPTSFYNRRNPIIGIEHTGSQEPARQQVVLSKVETQMNSNENLPTEPDADANDFNYQN